MHKGCHPHNLERDTKNFLRTVFWSWWFWRRDSRRITRAGEIIRVQYIRVQTCGSVWWG
jgi:hypothetical protein